MSGQLSRQATVQILSPDPQARGREQRAAIAALSALPQVASARAVPQEEVETLLAPWFGGGDIASDIPLPGLIDIALKVPADAGAIETLRGAVRGAAPSARIDADGVWLDPVLQAMRSLQWLAIALIALLAIATAATVVLAARSSLGNHRGTIAIVHLLGGTDHQISRLFQRRMALDAAFGSILGFIAGRGAAGAAGAAVGGARHTAGRRGRAFAAPAGGAPGDPAVDDLARAAHGTADHSWRAQENAVILRILSVPILAWMLGFAWFALLLPKPADDQKTDAVVGADRRPRPDRPGPEGADRGRGAIYADFRRRSRCAPRRSGSRI